MKDRHPRQQGIVLENREVVALVVGSLVVLGVVFYLGVSVGKSLAPAPAPVAEPPLEVLDRQAEKALAMDLTFPEKLTEETPPSEPATAGAPAVVEAAPEPAPAEPKKEPAPQAKPEPAPAPAKAEKPPAPEPSKPSPAQVEKAAATPRFVVQLASFPNREEADAFSKRVRAAGLSPRIVEAEIPGKGTYYRVRIGSFDSRDEAVRFLDDLRREGRFDGIVMPVDG